MTENDIIKLAQDKSFSDRALLEVMRVIRKHFGRGALTPNIRDALKDRKSIFDGLLVREKIDFTDNEGNILTRDLVYTVDLNEYLDLLCENRKLELNTTESVFGIDGGKKKLLVTLTLLENDDTDDNGNKKKDTSADRVQVVAAVEDVPENYENLKIILISLQSSTKNRNIH